MLIQNTLTEVQMGRLRLGNKLHKYGHLETWQELFMYQITCGDLNQMRDIGNFAKRFNKGEKINLPLKNNLFEDKLASSGVSSTK